MRNTRTHLPGLVGATLLTLSTLAVSGRPALADGPVIYSGGGAPANRVVTGPRYIMPSGVGFSYQAGYARTARPMVGMAYPRAAYGTGGYYGYGVNTGINSAPIAAPGYGYPGYGFGGSYGYLNGTTGGALGLGAGGAYPNGYSYPGYGTGFGSASPAFGYNYRGFYPW